MVLKRQNLEVLILLVILIFVVTACVRPLQPSADEAEATEAVEAEATLAMEEEEVSEEIVQSEEEVAGEVEEASEETPPAESAVETSEAESPRPEEEQATEEMEEPTATNTPEPEDTPTSTAESEAAESTPEQSEATIEPTPTSQIGETAEATEAAAAEVTATVEATQQATPSQQTAPSGETIHVVAPGENLYRIGLQYGLSWVPIAAVNGITDPDRIYVGQELIIPGTSTQPESTPTPKPPETPTYTNYVVQPGDTLSSISRKFGVSAQEIAEANGLVNPNRIYVGQVLKIPTSAPETSPELTHTVKSGETLYSISLQYGVNWITIAQANMIGPPYVIYAGQTLLIPGG